MLPAPVATVVIATYNGSKTIGEQLSALAEQRDAPHFEVLIIDNGSTDDLSGVTSRFSDRLDLRTIRAVEQQGQSYARNVGASNARSEVVLFCDQDDRVGPQWVMSMCTSLAAPGCFVSGPLELRYHNGDEARILFAGSDADEVTPYTVAGYLPFVYGCNLGMRKTNFLALGGFDNSYQGGGEDQDLSWRAIESGLRLQFSPTALVSYRLRNEPRDLFQQQIGYGRSGNLLRMRFADRGVLGPSPRWIAAHLPKAIATAIGLRLRPQHVTLAAAKEAGNVIGSAEALLRYQWWGQMPPTRRLEDQSASDAAAASRA